MHLYLIGYRGSGKSTVGKLLSHRLARAFVDTDDLIEQNAGMSIKEIFQLEGEAGFRDRETGTIQKVSSSIEPLVVGLGGGAILREENQSLLRATGRCAWLTGSAEYLHARIVGDASSELRRPQLSSRGGYEEVKALLSARQPIYASLAALTVNVEGQTPDEIVEEIAAWVATNNHVD